MGIKFKTYVLTLAFFLAVAITATTTSVFAQLNEQTWVVLGEHVPTSTSLSGNDIATDIAVDSVSGSVWVSGYTNSGIQAAGSTTAGSADAFLVEYGSTTTNFLTGALSFRYLDSIVATEQTSQLFGTSGDDKAFGVATDVTGTSNVYIAGYTTGDLDEDNDQNYDNKNAGYKDVFLMKSEGRTGTTTWVRLIGGSGEDVAYDVAVDDNLDKNVYFVGKTDSTPTILTFPNYGGSSNSTLNTLVGGFDVLLGKYKGDGDVTTSVGATNPVPIWTRIIGSTGVDVGKAIAVDEDFNVYVAGYTTGTFGSTSDTPAGGNDIFISKFDSNGIELWTRIMGTVGDDRGLDIVAYKDLKDNNETVFLYVTGCTDGALNGETAIGKRDAFVLKLKASDGTTQWTRLVGSTEDDEGLGISVNAATSKIHVTGWTAGRMDEDGSFVGTDLTVNAGGRDIFVVQVDMNVNGGTTKGAWDMSQTLGTAGDDVGIGVVGKRNSTALHVAGYTDGTPTGLSNPGGKKGANDVLDWKLSSLNRITVSIQDSFDFGTVVENGTASQTIRVTNTSGTPLTLSNIISNAPFNILNINTCVNGLLMEPGTNTSCTFDLQFNPTSPGTHIGSINIPFAGTASVISNNTLPLTGRSAGNTLLSAETATLTSPDPADADLPSICGTVVLFKWQASSGTDDQYWLYVGSNQGGFDIFTASQPKTTKSVSVSIPSSVAGNKVYVTLWTRQGTVWRFEPYQYICTVGASVTNTKAQFTTPPAAAATLTPTFTFKWNTGSNVTAYWLYVGTTQGGTSIFNSGAESKSTQQTVSGIPTSGAVHARLWSKFSNNTWDFEDKEYVGGPAL